MIGPADGDGSQARLDRVLHALVLGLCGLWALTMLVVFAARLTFPLELEWMEGGSLQQALRIQQGLPIYAEPGPDYVPFLYTPLYPALLATLGLVFPLGLALGRVVSVLAVVATCIALWRLVELEGKPLTHRALAVGLFLSGYVFCFRWLDVARADALFLALLIWSLVLLRHARDRWGRAAAAGVLMALAFWTKQTAAVFVLASGLGCLLVAPWQLLVYVPVIAVIDLGGVLVGQRLTGGWLWTYIYELHQTHAFNAERFRKKTWGMFVHAAPFVTIVSGPVAGAHARSLSASVATAQGEALEEARDRLRGMAFWGLMAVTGLLVSALGYSTQWAEPNAFIPGVCFGAAFVAVAMPTRGAVARLGLGLCAAQLLFSLAVEPTYQPIQDRGLAGLRESYAWQRPARTLPGREQRGRAMALRDQLRRAEGEVFAWHRPWWSVLASDRASVGHVGAMGLHDVTPEQREQIQSALQADVVRHRYAQMWFEGEPPPWLRREMAGHYRVEQRLAGRARVRPLTGYMSDAGMVTAYRRPQLLFVPIAERVPPPGARVVMDFESGRRGELDVKGAAFQRVIRSIHGDLPSVGPIGGAYYLSSAGGRAGVASEGTATTPPLELPEDGAVELLLGAGGQRKGLWVEIRDEGSDARVKLEIPKGAWQLKTVRWGVPDDWSGRRVRLHFVDESPRGALLVDDIWIHGEEPQTDGATP